MPYEPLAGTTAMNHSNDVSVCKRMMIAELVLTALTTALLGFSDGVLFSFTTINKTTKRWEAT